MKKRLVSVMLAAVLLAVSGCGASKDAEKDGEEQKTTIKLNILLMKVRDIICENVKTKKGSAPTTTVETTTAASTTAASTETTKAAETTKK